MTSGVLTLNPDLAGRLMPVGSITASAPILFFADDNESALTAARLFVVNSWSLRLAESVR
jgi:hypothetical protein